MSRAPKISRFPCGHDGCPEAGRYEYANLAEARRLQSDYGGGKWRCVRHTKPDEVLSVTNLRRTYEITSRQETYGRFFGHWGFTSGPGFKVFAKDFPPGTVLRVTAEIIMPTGEPDVS